MATSLVICGCTKKQIPKSVVNNNNNAQQVNTNTNTHPPINEPNPAENSIEVDIWPDVSFEEEDYKDWKTYTNTKLGYSIKYPADWEINACDEGCLTKEVIINPPDAESFVSYISISIDSRKLESIRKIYTDQKYVPSYAEKQIIFAGKEAFMFSIDYDRIIVISSKNIIYSISTGKDKNKQVQQALASFKFIDKEVVKIEDIFEFIGKDENGWNIYRSDGYGFEIKYPKFLRVIGDKNISITNVPEEDQEFRAHEDGEIWIDITNAKNDEVSVFNKIGQVEKGYSGQLGKTTDRYYNFELLNFDGVMWDREYSGGEIVLDPGAVKTLYFQNTSTNTVNVISADIPNKNKKQIELFDEILKTIKLID